MHQAPETVSNTTVQAAIKEFKPIFCQDGWQGIADAMANCYDKTDTKDPKIHQCILADIATQKTITKLDEGNRALGKLHTFIQYHAPFLEDDAFYKRSQYFILPTFLNNQKLKTLNPNNYYTENAINQFNQTLEKCDNK